MKRWILSVAAIALCWGAAEAAKPKKRPTVEDMERRLAMLDAEQEHLSMELNRKEWECYAILAEREGRVARLTDYPGVNLKAIRDSVPEIDALYERYDACYKAWQEILRTAPEYKKLHEEYRYAKNLPKDNPRAVENKAGYDRMYDSLRAYNPAYRPTVEARDKALFDRDMAVLRHVMEWYRQQGRMMPTQPVISMAQKNAIRNEWPEVGRMETELRALRSVRDDLFRQIRSARYGVE